MIYCCCPLFGVTNNRVYNDAFRTFTLSMQQSVSFTYQHVKFYHMTKKKKDNSFNFIFQNWERSTIEKTTRKHGDNSSFPLFIFF